MLLVAEPHAQVSPTMTDEDPSADRLAELIKRINQMEELLRQQAWRLYNLEKRTGFAPPQPGSPDRTVPPQPGPPPFVMPRQPGPSIPPTPPAPPQPFGTPAEPAKPTPPPVRPADRPVEQRPPFDAPRPIQPPPTPPVAPPIRRTEPVSDSNRDTTFIRDPLAGSAGLPPSGPPRPPASPPLQATPLSQPRPASAPPSFAPPTFDQPKAKPRLSIEMRIGGNWFQRIGVVAVILGILFFLKYAYDQKWIGKHEILWGFIALGVVTLFGADRLRKRYANYAYGLSGLGIAILYSSFFASYGLMRIWEPTSAFIGMAVVTAIATGLAARYNALPIAMLGLIGGFLTPIVLSTGEDHELGLFSYIALLDLGVLALAASKHWRSLNYLAFTGTVLIFIGWGDKHYSPEKLALTVIFLTIFFVIFALLAVLYNVVNRQPTRWLDLAMVFANALLYFGTSYRLLDSEPQYQPYLGLFAALVSVFYLGLGYFTYRRDREDRLLLYTFWGLAILFAVIAVPIQFHLQWITIGWAVEGAILTWIGLRVNDRISRYGALIVFLIAVSHWLIWDMIKFAYREGDDFAPLWNSRALSCAVLVAALTLATVFYRRLGEAIEEKERQMFKTLYMLGANALAVLLLSLDATDYFSRAQMRAFSDAGRPQGFVGGEQWRILDNTRHMTLSALWAIYGGVALVVGIVRSLKPLRAAALLLLVAVGAKLLLLDLNYYGAAWHLPILNATFGAFAAFIAACAVGAWFYAKATDIDEEEKTAVLIALAGAANLFAVVALSAEAIGYFDRLPTGEGHSSADYIENWKQFTLFAVWVVYGAVSCLIGIRRNHKLLRIASLVLMAIGAGKLLVVDLRYYREAWHMTFVNPTFLGLGLLVAALTVVWWYYSRATAIPDEERRFVVPLIVSGANLFAVLALSCEAIAFFDRRMEGENGPSIDPLLGYQQFVLSTVWIVYGTVCAFIGIRRNGKLLRAGAIGLLVLATLKVMAVDLWHSNEKWHTLLLNPTFGSFALLIAALCAVAWFYSRATKVSIEECRQMVPLLAGAANLLALVSLSAEIIGYFHRAKSLLQAGPTAADVSQAVSQTLNNMVMALSVLWIVYGATALVIGIRRDIKWLRVGALGLLTLATMKVLAVDLISYYDKPWHQPILNQTFAAFALLVAALAAAVWFYSRADNVDQEERRSLIPALVVVANLLAVLAFSADAYGHYAAQIASPPAGTDLHDLHLAQQLWLTIVWTVYGGALLTVGIWRRRPLLRMMALILLGLTITKVYLLDIWALAKLYRIIALILLGVVLLLVSFLYQPLRRRLAEAGDEAEAKPDIQ